MQKLSDYKNNASRTWELIEGFGTHTHFDNVYSITGNSSGTNWKESTYSRTVTNQVLIAPKNLPNRCFY